MADTRSLTPSWWRRWLNRMADTSQVRQADTTVGSPGPLRTLRRASPSPERGGDFLDTDSSWTYRIEAGPEAPRRRAPVLD